MAVASCLHRGVGFGGGRGGGNFGEECAGREVRL